MLPVVKYREEKFTHLTEALDDASLPPWNYSGAFVPSAVHLTGLVVSYFSSLARS